MGVAMGDGSIAIGVAISSGIGVTIGFVIGCALVLAGVIERARRVMKCTKVPGTLARTYANEHVCIFN